MTPEAWFQLFTQGAAVTGLIWLAFASSNGTIRWGKAVDAQNTLYEKQLTQIRADLDAERKANVESLARCEARNDQLFKDLRETVQAAHRAASVAGQAAEIASTVVRSQQ